jgi:hypothetical protein
MTMNKPMHEEIYKGHTIQIFYDEDPADPWRDWDNFGYMVLSHRRYTFPNDIGLKPQDVSSLVDVIEYLETEHDAKVILPIYMYEHGGIAVKVGHGFSDPWDSGQIGFIIATGDQIRKEYGVKRISRKVLEKVEDLLRSEAKIWGAYVSGDVYGYMVLDDDGEVLDSCWGFYGDYDYPISEAKDHIDWHLDHVYHQIPLPKEA